jgi:acetate---CoA ligase (ADP-forming)
VERPQEASLHRSNVGEVTAEVTDHVGYSGQSAAPWYQALVSPRRVAVVGASSDPAKGGLLRNLLRLGFHGDAVAVNPKGGTIDGLTAVADIRDVDEPVDLALVAVPARHVPDAIRGCADAGVQVAYIVSSGFAELGEQGAELQAQAVREAARGGVRLVGPNTNGIISARSGLAGSIMTPVGDLSAPLTSSGVAVITQSGAIGAFIFTGCLAAGLPVGTYTSTGNEADVGFEELLSALVDDPSVQVILAYVEGLRDGAGFIKAARRAQELGKPIVLLKVGVTDAGARAAASHTASMAGHDIVYQGVLRQLGVRRAGTLRELIDAGRLLVATPTGVGSRIGVVTISGGLAVMATDEIVRRSLQLPAWNAECAARLGEILPDYVTVQNPLDTSGVIADDVALLRTVLETASSDDQIDVILLSLGGSRSRERSVVAALSEIVPTLAKPVLVVWVGASSEFPVAVRRSGITGFTSIEAALAAVSVARRTPRPAGLNESLTPGGGSNRQALVAATALIVRAQADGRTALDEVDSKAILRAFGVPTVAERVLDVDDESQLPVDLAYPVVAKLRSPQLMHKSDVGAVRIGLSDPAAAQRAVSELRALAGKLQLAQSDIVIQQQVSIGAELILGASEDPTFGPVITVGIGGVAAEVEPDIQILLPSLNRSDVVGAIDQLRSQRLLDGFRGAAPVSLPDLADTVLRFADMVCALSPWVSEIDVNPLIADRQGRLVAVDGLMVLRRDGEAN